MRIARAVGMPLQIAAKVPRGETTYFRECIEPQVDGKQVRLIGEVNDHAKQGFLAGAAALLFPIDWPEPFGLVMIEAMACGTPVIAFRSGSVPEVVDHGITGFVVSNEDEAIQAIGRLGELDRRRIRAQFEKRFTSRRMAEEYLKHYAALAPVPNNVRAPGLAEKNDLPEQSPSRFHAPRQDRRVDDRPQKQTEEPEGSKTSEDSDKGEKKRKTRRVADQGRPHEMIAGKHDDRAPAKYCCGRKTAAIAGRATMIVDFPRQPADEQSIPRLLPRSRGPA